MTFHEVRFPTDISLGSSGGPERRTDIVTLRSGYEERNAVWQHSRRSYDAGLGMRTTDDLHTVLEFWEARLGRLYGFRWRDWSDYKSCAPLQAPSAADQLIGHGDGARKKFQIVKKYVSGGQSYTRPIVKLVGDTFLASVDGLPLAADAYSVALNTGVITFDVAPGAGLAIRCGYEFDVPVRFADEKIDIDMAAFKMGSVPQVGIVELRIPPEDIG